MAGVVNAVAGKKVDDGATVEGGELRPDASFIDHVHLQQVQQLGPLRIYVISIRLGR